MITCTKPTTRTARWISDNPALALETGGALLSLTVPRKQRNGEVVPLTTYYAVFRITCERTGKVTGYRLLKEEGGRFAETRDIDVSFGPLPKHWTCCCGAYSWRTEQLCKHAAGLGNALAAIGL